MEYVVCRCGSLVSHRIRTLKRAEAKGLGFCPSEESEAYVGADPRYRSEYLRHRQFDRGLAHKSS